jgi:hypothetical protein
VLLSVKFYFAVVSAILPRPFIKRMSANFGGRKMGKIKELLEQQEEMDRRQYATEMPFFNEEVNGDFTDVLENGGTRSSGFIQQFMEAVMKKWNLRFNDGENGELFGTVDFKDGDESRKLNIKWDGDQGQRIKRIVDSDEARNFVATIVSIMTEPHAAGR